MGGGGVGGAEVPYMMWHGVRRMMGEWGNGDVKAGTAPRRGGITGGLPLSVALNNVHKRVPKGGQYRCP